MTTPTPLTEVPAQEDLLHKYKERVERLSQQDRLIKICVDAGFLTTVDVAQYFMTKDTEEFSQFTEPVACREYTLPRDEKSSDPKGWIRGNTKIVSVSKVTTSYLQDKDGVEIRIESVNKDNSHSWVIISHGLKELVTDLSDNEYIMVIYIQKKMEQLNSGDQKIVFGTNLTTLSIGLMKCVRVQWEEAEATRKYFNIVVTRQDKNFFISELFNVIQDEIPLILHYRTMCKFRTISSSTFITSDVQSIYTPPQMQD